MTITVYGDGTRRTRIPIERKVEIFFSNFEIFLTFSIPDLQYVVGWVFGEAFSSVSGYVVDNVFYGSIFVDNEIYYVDPYRV